MSSVPCRTSALAGLLSDTVVEYSAYIGMSNRAPSGCRPKACLVARCRHCPRTGPGRRDASSGVDRESGRHAGSHLKAKGRRNPPQSKLLTGRVLEIALRALGEIREQAGRRFHVGRVIGAAPDRLHPGTLSLREVVQDIAQLMDLDR
jgi:hypothetical protein